MCGRVVSVTLLATRVFAGDDRANLHNRALLRQLLRHLLINVDIAPGHVPSGDDFPEDGLNLVGLCDKPGDVGFLDFDTIGRTAVIPGDNIRGSSVPHLAHGVARVSSIQRLVDKTLPATVGSNEMLKRSQLLRVGVFNNRTERLSGRLLNPSLVAIHLRQVGLATTGAGLCQSDEPRLFAHTVIDGILHLLFHPLKALIVGISECGLLLKAALIIPDHLFHGVMELLYYITVGDVLFIQKVESRRVDVAHLETT